MNLLQKGMLRFYTLLVYSLLPFVFLRLLWKSVALPAYRKRLLERLGFSSRVPFLLKSIWVHAVSLGEVNAAAPLVRELQRQFPSHPILMTTTTPTGSLRVRDLFGKTVYHSYFPYDAPFFLRRFFRKVNPDRIIILETELWPNMICLAQQRHIPLFIVNARLAEQSFSRYYALRYFFKPILKNVTHIMARHKQDAEKFLKLGVLSQHISVVGNLKFDCFLPGSIGEQAKALKGRFAERPILMAASTHEGEEEKLLEAFSRIRFVLPNLLALLAPRNPERFLAVEKLCQQHHFSVEKWSHAPHVSESTSILLVDTIGDLLLLYGISDIAFVGGSLVPKGGHNILEPALWKRPILIGPHTHHFKEIVERFDAENALHVVHTADELANTVIHLMQHPNERAELGERCFTIIESNRGALQKTVECLSRYFPDF
ncbi:MAG: lipid IV(A) 3-deoxy-D-manno-octulosonic acid transferase [Gammaproteobacteria bacterium]|nr:lipid IV(A) 3-deoxy-D-manno-octulosonic acid transferase [Gammaproteobacteria bacterium]